MSALNSKLILLMTILTVRYSMVKYKSKSGYKETMSYIKLMKLKIKEDISYKCKSYKYLIYFLSMLIDIIRMNLSANSD